MRTTYCIILVWLTGGALAPAIAQSELADEPSPISLMLRRQLMADAEQPALMPIRLRGPHGSTRQGNSDISRHAEPSSPQSRPFALESRPVEPTFSTPTDVESVADDQDESTSSGGYVSAGPHRPDASVEESGTGMIVGESSSLHYSGGCRSDASCSDSTLDCPQGVVSVLGSWFALNRQSCSSQGCSQGASQGGCADVGQVSDGRGLVDDADGLANRVKSWQPLNIFRR